MLYSLILFDLYFWMPCKELKIDQQLDICRNFCETYANILRYYQVNIFKILKRQVLLNVW